MMPAAPATGLIRLDGITKRFGGLTALDRVGFEIAEGEVHAIVGENGAGKSTLMKMLAGVCPPDEGAVFLRGSPADLSSPAGARRLGITIVFQELNLFPHLTVAGNIFANRERSSRLGLLDERSMVEASREALESMGVDIDPRSRVSRLSIAERQIVEIARTLSQAARIIILDEPNSALSEAESVRLFELIRRLRAQGVTILYVSHRLEEVLALADRITVLRDGRYQGTWRAAETTVERIIAAMIGRRLEETFPARGPVTEDAPILLDVRGLTAGSRVGPISFQVRAGEILGFAGLEGSGIDEMFRLLFGLEPATAGEVVYGGSSRSAGTGRLVAAEGLVPAKRPIRSAGDAIRRGLALIPRSRREEGLIMDWSIRRNSSLVILDRLLGLLGLLSRAAERRTAGEQVRRLGIVTNSTDKKVIHLSGGNQQKVVLAKWLASEPRVLLLNDPTRGVDVGAKAEIYRLCAELAQKGLAILLTSSEIDETLGLADRILVLRKGRVSRELRRGEATKAEVMRVAEG